MACEPEIEIDRQIQSSCANLHDIQVIYQKRNIHSKLPSCFLKVQQGQGRAGNRSKNDNKDRVKVMSFSLKYIYAHGLPTPFQTSEISIYQRYTDFFSLEELLVVQYV